MSLLIPELERQFREVVRTRSAGSVRSGRRRVRGLRGLAVGLAVVPAVAVAVLALIVLRHTPTQGQAGRSSASNIAANAPQQPNVPPAEWSYIQAAHRVAVARDPACSTSAGRESTISDGAPGRALLATLGVLRQPRTAADVLPQPLSQALSTHGLGTARELFVNFVRRARSVLGASFYIIPAGNIDGLKSVPARCTGEEDAALRRELPRIPKSLRAQTVSFQARYLTWQRYTAAHPQGIALATTASIGGGGIAAGWTVADIDRGMAGLGQGGIAVGSRNTRRVFGGTGLHGIVPDEVATVTLHYPVRSVNGRPVSVTVKVINNIFIAPNTARRLPPAISWYDAHGHLIKTVNLAPLTRGR
jgi:hypothetical protein